MLSSERGWAGSIQRERRATSVRRSPSSLRWPLRWRHRRHDVPGALFDLLAVAAAGTLGVLGYRNLVAMGSVSEAQHQLIALEAGMVLLVVLRLVRGDRVLRLVAWAAYLASLVLLVAVRVVGLQAYGARRWLALGGFTFQPSEMAKIGVLMVAAVVLAAPRPTLRRVLLAVGLAVVPLLLVALQPDLSTALLLALTTSAVLVVARVPARLLVPLAAGLALLAPLAVGLLRPYQLDRLQAFTARSGAGPSFAVQQAHIAVASGGWFGLPDGPLTRLASQYLPGRETDFALASLVQHEGLAAAGLALLAEAVLVWRCAAASRVAGSRAASTIAAGLAVLLGVEALVSVGGNLGMLPVAGVPFPLLSYGGTAAAVHLAALGLALGARRGARQQVLWTVPAARHPRPRLVRLAALGTTVALGALGLQGYDIVVHQGPALRASAAGQMTRCVTLPAARGQITDRHGAVLARDLPLRQLQVVPALLRAKAGAVPRLARLMGWRASSVRSALRRSSNGLTLTLANVPVARATRIQAAALPGVLVVRAPGRAYPTGALLGPILGFTGVATPDDVARLGSLPPGEQVGRAGLEQEYDAVLRGVDGRQCFYVDPQGRPVALGSRTAPIAGASLRTTLDLGLQRALTSALQRAMNQGRGRDLGGSVVMDPRNGQVLAMASLPSYDNAVYGPPASLPGIARAAAGTGNPMLEHVTQVAAPPGSTFKLVVAATDMVHRVLSPRTVVPTGGSFTYGGHVFGNWMTLGPQNLTQAMAWSNDVYFYKLALALGPRAIDEVGSALGVGHPTGIDLPGESGGFLGSPDNVRSIGATWYAGSTVILGIGQGYITATPLQDALWTAAVATGSRVTPHLGLAVVTGSSVAALPFRAPARLPFADALGPVRAGMRAAVTQGTAAILNNLPVAAGGKTGSAEDARAGNGKPSSWFTAVAPLPGPRFVATSYVRGGEHGATTSGPVVDSALAYALAHEQQVLGTTPAAAVGKQAEKHR